jgi:DNA transformation protein
LDPEHIRELFAAFGPVDVRRMFSGAGVFADGVMIALVASGVLYLKADEQTIPSFEQEGLTPFSYATKGGRHTIMSYWRMPDRLYDDVDELAEWARAALAAAHRTSQSRRPASRAKRKSTRRPARKAARKVRRPGSR